MKNITVVLALAGALTLSECAVATSAPVKPHSSPQPRTALPTTKPKTKKPFHRHAGKAKAGAKQATGSPFFGSGAKKGGKTSKK